MYIITYSTKLPDIVYDLANVYQSKEFLVNMSFDLPTETLIIFKDEFSKDIFDLSNIKLPTNVRDEYTVYSHILDRQLHKKHPHILKTIINDMCNANKFYRYWYSRRDLINIISTDAAILRDYLSANDVRKFINIYCDYLGKIEHKNNTIYTLLKKIKKVEWFDEIVGDIFSLNFSKDLFGDLVSDKFIKNKLVQYANHNAGRLLSTKNYNNRTALNLLRVFFLDKDISDYSEVVIEHPKLILNYCYDNSTCVDSSLESAIMRDSRYRLSYIDIIMSYGSIWKKSKYFMEWTVRHIIRKIVKP